jgi:group I intron endonuclease
VNQPYGHIYKITNVVTGKSYIGQTTQKDPMKRVKKHLHGGSGSILSKAVKKYGRDCFQYEFIAEGVDKFDLDNLERFYIKSLNTVSPNGYNLAPGGQLYGTISEETRKKISIANTGKTHSVETRKKLSESHKGQRSSPATEFKKGMVSPNKGKKLSVLYPHMIALMSKKVIDSNGRIYSSTKEVGEVWGVRPDTVKSWCQGRGKNSPFLVNNSINFSYLDTQQTNIAYERAVQCLQA